MSFLLCSDGFWKKADMKKVYEMMQRSCRMTDSRMEKKIEQKISRCRRCQAFLGRPVDSKLGNCLVPSCKSDCPCCFKGDKPSKERNAPKKARQKNTSKTRPQRKRRKEIPPSFLTTILYSESLAAKCSGKMAVKNESEKRGEEGRWKHRNGSKNANQERT